MIEQTRPPIWLRGNIPGVPESMQSVAHGLLSMLEEVEQAAGPLTPSQLWQSVGGAATAGFHLRHLAGSTSRLFTYASGVPLSEHQRAALDAEKIAAPERGAEALLQELRKVVRDCLTELRGLDESQLDETRAVGRAGSFSTARCILHHAAEHAARHSGQVITTARVVQFDTR